MPFTSHVRRSVATVRPTSYAQSILELHLCSQMTRVSASGDLLLTDEDIVSEFDYQNGNNNKEEDPHKFISFQNGKTRAHKRTEHITDGHEDCCLIEYVVCKTEIEHGRQIGREVNEF